MDGIAVSSNAVTSTGLKIAGTQAAGSAPLTLPASDQCIEIMTGAQLPLGCNCVIPVERIRRDNGVAYLDDDIQLSAFLNVHRRGSDARQGDAILAAGTRLNAAEIAVIASAGYSSAQVHDTPRIAVISTGDELIEPGSPIQDWQIRRSNSYALIAALHKQGLSDITDVHLRDDPQQLRTQLSALLEQHDALILSGGVSAGKFDYVPHVLNEIGVTTIFHKILQRPGKPMWFGVRDDGKAVYALPGNPVSILVCLHRYVLRGLQRAMGITQFSTAYARLSVAAKTHDQFTCFVPVQLHDDNSRCVATPHPTRGSGDFISLLNTDGFAELPASEALIPAHTIVPVYRW
jgi:molybdopterin molybdotransferase